MTVLLAVPIIRRRWLLRNSPKSAGAKDPLDRPDSARALAEQENPNIVHWSEFDRGGHFAAMEEPELFVEDVRKFFRGLR